MIKASISGEDDPHCSEVKQFCQKLRRDDKGNMVALGDIAGYTFKHSKGIEGVWDSVANTVNEAFASTMNNIALINTTHNQNVSGKKKDPINTRAQVAMKRMQSPWMI